MEKKAEKATLPSELSLQTDNPAMPGNQNCHDWENLLDNITDMITIHDMDYNIIHANKAAQKLLKLPTLKNTASKCFMHYHGEETPPTGCPSCACINTKEPVTFERFEPHLNRFLEIRAMPQFDKNNQLIGVIHIARDITRCKQMEDEITSLKKHLLTGELENEAAFASVITRSKKMLAIFQYIESVAKSEKPIFITGETGVGKELIAKAAHSASGLKGSFIAVNVAGLDDTMFSDTLFGHKRGAFTGADKERKGLVVQASGGTLLLDEIGDLHISSQVKLLRLLEEQTYYPLGSDIPEKCKARIVTCSNQDIEKQLDDGHFRRDLYYRLITHHVHIPSLRERLQDIPLLLDHFLKEISFCMKKEKPCVTPELITLLSNYHFPGNVRELQAMIHDAVAQHKSGCLNLESFNVYIKQRRLLPQSSAVATDDNSPSIRDMFGHFPTLKEMENHLVSEAMKSSNDNQGNAANLLGITRQALNQRLKKTNQNS